MFTSSLSLGLALLPFASAVVHDIQVGYQGKLQFYPEAIGAAPGDQVVFHYVSKNHTVTQSSFASPCGLAPGGFDSGFEPVAANQTDNFPTFSLTVPDTKPIWVHCRQTTPVSHCGMGMVFAINCGQDGAPNSFTNFKASALAIGAAQASAAPPAASAPAGAYGGYGGGYGAPAPTPDAAVAAQPEWTVAAYGDYTIPAAPQVTTVTKAITVGDKIWTTTYASYPGSPDPTPAAVPNVIQVTVGGPGKLAFDPPSVQAKPNDIVVFNFLQKNHSVTQSTFSDPCRPMNVNGKTGFDTGFMPVADGVAQGPSWNYTVVDTSPVWAFCRQPNPSSHCGAGMVFAINAVESSERNFTAFKNVAEALNGTLVAANIPSPAPSSGSTGANASSAASLRFGAVPFVVTVAAVVASFL